MEIAYALFDEILESNMGGLIFGGDVTWHIYHYYSDNDFVLDNDLLGEIQNDWTEINLEDEFYLSEEEIDEVTSDKETLVQYLIQQNIIESKDIIDMKSLFISEEVHGRVAWKEL